MSATPRARPGAFPQTPATRARGRAPPTPSPSPPSPSLASRRASGRAPLPPAPLDNAPAAPATANGRPVIPFTMLDAPSQRLYAIAAYVALAAWKFYDWSQLVDDGAESFWYFMKWVCIDLVFLFGLSELRIPWMELSQFTLIGLFALHAFLNWMLMFQVPVPWMAAILQVVKLFYDRGEMSISEHRVKASNILHNASLIQGRQIINILPEGSAILNPDALPFCLGGDRKKALAPLFFNATIPVEVELIRTDFETGAEESVMLKRGQLRDIERLIKRESPQGKPATVRYDFPITKTGAYRLGRVLDEYKLEVQRRTANTYIVPCPSAKVQAPPSAGRCLGDLSDLSLLVDGTPPLKIVYSRMINGKDHSFHFQSLQPEGFSSPLLAGPRSSSIIFPDDEDVSWAATQQVTVGLNESMNIGGEWQYSIDEVHDAFGNVAKYVSPAEDPDMRPKPKHLVQNFLVKERPTIRLQGCDLRNPLKVAKNKAINLPVKLDMSGRQADDGAYTVSWQFSPIDTLTKSGDHGEVVSTGSHKARNANDKPTISAPGLYTMKSVSAGSCEGEVQEPASCLLLNPLEPSLTLRSEEIPDTCAGNSIGLRVDLDLVGTPPFVVRYNVISNGDVRHERMNVPGMRSQLELIPRVAGSHKYIFTAIDDAVYKAQQLTGPDMVLEQSVKPAARARINHQTGRMTVCLEEEVGVEVALYGEAPFTLEYELLHEGKRQQFTAADIESNKFQIVTPELYRGGEYALALTSVTDKSGCRNFVQDEMKISVSRQRPRAAFGHIDGKRKAMVIEDARVRLPLRLTGDGPWTLHYRNVDDGSATVERTLKSGNDFIEVSSRGTYELLDVVDKQCGGAVDPTARTFEVGWFPRPELSLVPTESISSVDEKYLKQEVCEGDIDSFAVALQGSPPYHVEYDVRFKAGKQGSGSISKKEFDAALGRSSIQMDTSKPGFYTYTFSALADNLYVNNKRKHAPLVLEQTVNARPTAEFAKPGQSFKYCMNEQDNEDRIPIVLTGLPPFALEIEVKHQSGAIPETYRIPSIDTTKYGMQIPRTYMRLGTQHIHIRKVSDARGCQQHTALGGASVQVQLFDAPAMYPLETRTDYCVGERIAYTLSGTPPFEVWYTFDDTERKAKSPTTNFRRVAESAGVFAVNSVRDRASECRAAVHISKTIHPMPSVRISKGRISHVDIHEGGEVDLLFEFTGTPPFEYTYTRSTNARRGARSEVLETRHDVSYEHSKVIKTSQEGTYDVVAIKDKFCAFSTQHVEGKEQKLLTY